MVKAHTSWAKKFTILKYISFIFLGAIFLSFHPVFRKSNKMKIWPLTQILLSFKNNKKFNDFFGFFFNLHYYYYYYYGLLYANRWNDVKLIC
jgi:hypothetical protein